MVLKATPVAFSMALRIAGAGPSIGSSPMPLAPLGAVDARHLFKMHMDRGKVGCWSA